MTDSKTDWVEWMPEHAGHKPPFWQDGMAWDVSPFRPSGILVGGGDPLFAIGQTYRVPREAVYGPAVDWAEPICIQAETWQAELPATVVEGPNEDGEYKVRVDAPHVMLENGRNYVSGKTWWFNSAGEWVGGGTETIRVINKSVAPSVDPVLYERMAKVIGQIPRAGLPADIQTELYAIAAELEPVDPILKLAREVCDEVNPMPHGTKYTDGKVDHLAVIKAAVAMGKAMQERGI